MSPADALGGLLGGGSSTPSVRRPAVRVSFGGGAGGGGGLSGLASAASGALGLGGEGPDPWAESLVAVTVEGGLAPFVNAAEVELAPGGRAPAVALGDEGSVALGFGDQGPATVFTGQVWSLSRGLGRTLRFTATDAGGKLARLRVNQAFEAMSAGDVVQQLASSAGVTPGQVQAGERFPYLVLDDRRTAWDHLAELARRSGLLGWVTSAGEVVFAAVTPGSPAQTFAYGADLLSLDAWESPPALGAVTVRGDGAAGSKGQDAWSWFAKDPGPVTGQAGSGAPERSFRDGALRSGQAVNAAASSLADAAGRGNVTVAALVPGAPAVGVGGTVRLSGCPQAELDGEYLVARVRHRYAKGEGFTTTLRLVGLGGGGGAGAGGGLL
ncbi:MAG: hypothetical protein HZB55_07310 [Deltaproteobacteria bacterium]|nr:hypothetical protein [Deltaproteobacteria bacterium]